MDVISEGAETESDAVELAQLGCQFLLGQRRRHQVGRVPAAQRLCQFQRAVRTNPLPGQPVQQFAPIRGQQGHRHARSTSTPAPLLRVTARR